jgi:hypothetical protein
MPGCFVVLSGEMVRIFFPIRLVQLNLQVLVTFHRDGDAFIAPAFVDMFPSWAKKDSFMTIILYEKSDEEILVQKGSSPARFLWSFKQNNSLVTST